MSYTGYWIHAAATIIHRNDFFLSKYASETSRNTHLPGTVQYLVMRMRPSTRAEQHTVRIFRMSRMYVVVDIFVDTSVRLK